MLYGFYLEECGLWVITGLSMVCIFLPTKSVNKPKLLLDMAGYNLSQALVMTGA